MTDTGLAAVADSGADVENWDGPDQAVVPDSAYTKIKFSGVNYDSLSMDPKIGDEYAFIVRGRVIDVGDRALKTSGEVQHRAEIDVTDVIPYDEETSG